jgi:hypothetical protein
MCEITNIYGFFNMKYMVHSGWQNGVNTCNTVARVHGIRRVYKLGYRTRTRKTHDLKLAGFLVPVANPIRLLRHISDSEVQVHCQAQIRTGHLELILWRMLKAFQSL